MNDLLATFAIGFGVAAILAYPIYRLLIALKSRQTVSQHIPEHAHKQGTPTMGGLIILAGAIPALLYWNSLGTAGRAIPTLILVVGYALIGFLDDFVVPRMKQGSRGLGWMPKLVMQIGFAWLAAWTLGTLSPWGMAFSIFLILFYSNAYNFADGLDWLAATLFMGLGGSLVVMTFRLGTPDWIYPLAGFLGASIPFLFINRPPAKLFMGDVGSMAIGGLLGLVFSDMFLTGMANTEGRDWLIVLGLTLVSVVMVIELVPVPLQILGVKLLKRRIFPPTPIHHAFQKAGWPEPKIVGLFFAIQLIGSALGIFCLRMAGL